MQIGINKMGTKIIDIIPSNVAKQTGHVINRIKTIIVSSKKM